ncbi:MAG: DUF2232 domain-containing protein [Spirulinaceae cyanobacterium SM2_1_0]|nr:DUF2232 domain-containing protein [Spirulinaceae cyanobacterium SM2_1_0]
MQSETGDREVNWVDADDDSSVEVSGDRLLPPTEPEPVATSTLVVVETAFLASAASLIWLINYYFPLGPILRLLFPIPIALIYLRRGQRAAWMGALVSGLLLSVLMGPTRSIQYVIPFGLLGVQLGAIWRRRGSWYFAIATGMLLGTFGVFFRLWLASIVIGENVWIYAINQMTVWIDWAFIQLGILSQPGPVLIQSLVLCIVLLNNLLYMFAVHLVALLIFDRLGNPITRPPHWVQVLFEYDY